MLDHFLSLLLAKNHLTQQEMETALDLVLSEADPYQVAAFLAILKYRGETSEEILGMAMALTNRAVVVRLPYPTLDIVGTGGDLAHTVNISTGSAILAAACGIPVAKHGNRSVSSRSGSADVLEALGIDIELPPDQLPECVSKVGIVFMFAPCYHPSLKLLGPIRKGLRFPTAFNMLGPLLNPAGAEYSLIGVANPNSLERVSQVILKLKNKTRTLLFHGCGLDELTPLGKSIAYDIHEGQIHRFEIDPQSLGFSSCSLKELQGGDAQTNALILRETFAGKPGAIADSLILNAGAALWIFNRVGSLQEGVYRARKVLQEGKALAVLEKWKIFCNARRSNEKEELSR